MSTDMKEFGRRATGLISTLQHCRSSVEYRKITESHAEKYTFF